METANLAFVLAALTAVCCTSQVDAQSETPAQVDSDAALCPPMDPPIGEPIWTWKLGSVAWG